MNSKIVIGDLHLKIDTKNNLIILINQVLNYLKDKKSLDYDLVFVGDIYNDKAIIRSEIQSFLYNLLKDISNKFRKIYVLAGNHDLENKDSDKSSLGIFKYIFKNIIIIDSTYQVHDDCLFVPYKNNAEKFNDIISKYASNNIKNIFCHQAINGFLLNNSMSCSDGIAIKNLLNFNGNILAGHFHKPQNNKNIYYIGSAWSQNFSEANDEKRFIVLNNDNTINSITIDGIGRHIFLNIDAYDEENKSKEILSKLNSNDIIKIEITGIKKDVDFTIQDILNNNKDSFYKISLNAKYINSNKKSIIKENSSLEDMLNKYIEYNSENFNDVNLSLLKAKGLEYLKYAKI